MRGKRALIISLSLIVAALSFLLYTGLNSNMVYYYHVDEFLPKAASLNGETVKVNGKVLEGTIKKQQMDYQFTIHGAKDHLVNVSYHGVVPDTFKDGSDVVVEGVYNPDVKVFHATTLLAKCPTKYESKQPEKKTAQN
jgi:cytochrome c-type biogenesis protein CcmE